MNLHSVVEVEEGGCCSVTAWDCAFPVVVHSPYDSIWEGFFFLVRVFQRHEFNLISGGTQHDSAQFSVSDPCMNFAASSVCGQECCRSLHLNDIL